jgi:hypothetical protein
MSALAEAGIRLKSETPGTHRTRCPECNRKGHDDALAVTIKLDGSAVWLCHRCREFKGALTPPGERAVPLLYKAAGHSAPVGCRGDRQWAIGWSA